MIPQCNNNRKKYDRARKKVVSWPSPSRIDSNNKNRKKISHHPYWFITKRHHSDNTDENRGEYHSCIQHMVSITLLEGDNWLLDLAFSIGSYSCGYTVCCSRSWSWPYMDATMNHFFRVVPFLVVSGMWVVWVHGVVWYGMLWCRVVSCVHDCYLSVDYVGIYNMVYSCVRNQENKVVAVDSFH